MRCPTKLYVLGPGKQIYIVDHHHLERALFLRPKYGQFARHGFNRGAFGHPGGFGGFAGGSRFATGGLGHMGGFGGGFHGGGFSGRFHGGGFGGGAHFH